MLCAGLRLNFQPERSPARQPESTKDTGPALIRNIIYHNSHNMSTFMKNMWPVMAARQALGKQTGETKASEQEAYCTGSRKLP